MHLARSTTRSKSRSPAPPQAPQFQSSSPRPFLPPAHYAAAAGVAYPTSKNGDTANANVAEPRHPMYLPVRYASDASGSEESAGESPLACRSRTRSISLSRKGSATRTPEQAVDQRKSQMGEVGPSSSAQPSLYQASYSPVPDIPRSGPRIWSQRPPPPPSPRPMAPVSPSPGPVAFTIPKSTVPTTPTFAQHPAPTPRGKMRTFPKSVLHTPNSLAMSPRPDDVTSMSHPGSLRRVKSSITGGTEPREEKTSRGSDGYSQGEQSSLRSAKSAIPALSSADRSVRMRSSSNPQKRDAPSSNHLGLSSSAVPKVQSSSARSRNAPVLFPRSAVEGDKPTASPSTRRQPRPRVGNDDDSSISEREKGGDKFNQRGIQARTMRAGFYTSSGSENEDMTRPMTAAKSPRSRLPTLLGRRQDARPKIPPRGPETIGLGFDMEEITHRSDKSRQTSHQDSFDRDDDRRVVPCANGDSRDQHQRQRNTGESLRTPRTLGTRTPSAIPSADLRSRRHDTAFDSSANDREIMNSSRTDQGQTPSRQHRQDALAGLVDMTTGRDLRERRQRVRSVEDVISSMMDDRAATGRNTLRSGEANTGGDDVSVYPSDEEAPELPAGPVPSHRGLRPARGAFSPELSPTAGAEISLLSRARSASSSAEKSHSLRRSKSIAALPSATANPGLAAFSIALDGETWTPRSSNLSQTAQGREGKFSGRSPVIRQSAGVTLPAALRRYSVYEQIPAPPPSDTRPSQAAHLDPRWQWEDHGEHPMHEYHDGSASESGQSFGESQPVYLAPSDSTASSIYSSTSGLWNEDVEASETSEKLSLGAESLFRHLGGSDTSLSESSIPTSPGYGKSPTSARKHKATRRPRVTVVTPSSTSSSSFADQRHVFASSEPQAILALGRDDENSHNYLVESPPSVNDAPMVPTADLESARQVAISELCDSERTFVNRMQHTVKLFVKPLRVQSTKEWIRGVPSGVGHLFDWLEDIANLHSQISVALDAAKKQGPAEKIRIGQTLREFIPRLEIYQPYLVKVESVTEIVRTMVANKRSHLGEFIRMQETEGECAGRKLVDLLQEPVDRLGQYLDLFRRLLETTAQDHDDHLAAFSLLHSTDMIVAVMQEVKTREYEYEDVKDMVARIQDMPPQIHLARRERRLLMHGSVLRVAPRELTCVSTPRGTVTEKTGDSRADRLARAVQGRQGPFSERSGSTDSYGSMWSSAASASSASSFAPGPRTPSFPYHTTGSSHPAPALSPRTRTEPRHFQPPPSLETTNYEDAFTQEQMQVFVFTDLAVFAMPIPSTKEGNGSDGWRLINGSGICRILRVKVLDGVAPISLDLLPIQSNELQTGVIPDRACVLNLRLGFSERTAPDIEDAWLAAFRQCHRHTLRSLSFPSHSGSFLAHGPGVDLEADTKQSVVAILAAGLPLPKSPSIQFGEAVMEDRANDDVRLEREERGWWALRFQQVLREMQRREEPKFPTRLPQL